MKMLLIAGNLNLLKGLLQAPFERLTNSLFLHN